MLGADTLIRGQIAGDQELSGIVYFLWNDTGLYVGGLTVGADRIAVQIGQRTLNLTRGEGGWLAAIGTEATACPSAEIADVGQFVDARYLTFAEIDDRIGNVRPVRRAVRGRTFELHVPWQVLGIRPDRDASLTIQIQGDDDATLRIPPDGAGEDGALVFAD